MKSNIYANRKLQYRQLLKFGLIVSLAFHVLLFQGYKKFELKTMVSEFNVPEIKGFEIPITRPDKITMPPKKPTTVIPSEDEEIPQSETIALTGLVGLVDMDVPPPPPPPSLEGPSTIFIYDQPPTPVGGYSSILNNLIYPKMAKMLGIEGTVIVQTLIDEKGVVIETRILQSLDSYGCDEAADNAIRATKWNPAYQRDMPVKVWVAIPITFKLADNK